LVTDEKLLKLVKITRELHLAYVYVQHW